MELTGGDHNNSDFRDLRANLPSSYQIYQNVETRSRMISSAIWEKKRCDRRRRHEVRQYRSGNGWGRDDSEYGDLRANLPSSYPYQRRENSYDLLGYVGEKKGEVDMKLGGMGNRVHWWNRDGMYLIEQTPVIISDVHIKTWKLGLYGSGIDMRQCRGKSSLATTMIMTIIC
jgi:hypothetical protein